MKKTETLKKNYEFRRVLTKGKYYSGKYIEAFCLKKNENKNKIGIAVNTKIAKAFKRNYLKRIIRENYRLNEDKFTGIHIVFLVKRKSNVDEINYYTVNKDIIKIIKDINRTN